MERKNQKEFPSEIYYKLAENIRLIQSGHLKPEDIGISARIMEKMLEKTAERANEIKNAQKLAEETQIARQNINVTSFKTQIALLDILKTTNVQNLIRSIQTIATSLNLTGMNKRENDPALYCGSHNLNESEPTETIKSWHINNTTYHLEINNKEKEFRLYTDNNRLVYEELLRYRF